MPIPHPVYTAQQQASLIKRSKRKGYKVQWRAGELNYGWRDLDRQLEPKWFEATQERDVLRYNLYRVVKIKCTSSNTNP